MVLHQKIVIARKKKGITQEELADLAKVTIRTIQRIESGETTPRNFTLKAIATALETPFEELNAEHAAQEKYTDHLNQKATYDKEETKYFLQLFCLSCFAYIVVPFIHFLIPAHLLKKRNEQSPNIIDFARKIIRLQIYWVITLHFLLLLTLSYNFFNVKYLYSQYSINYLWLFFFMYFINALIISINLFRVKRMGFTTEEPIST